MITTGDIEFEPPTRKIWGLTPSVFVMTAGDTTLQTEIMRDVEIDVVERVLAEPNNWWRVRDVAELYRGKHEEIRARRAESALLMPLGLDSDSFIANQADMDRQLVSNLVSDLTNFSLPGVQSIFLGIDNDGPALSSGPGAYPHIYVSNGGHVACYDAIGFAAIGIGDWHAQSQFMFAKYWKGRPLPEALFLAYSAKKHAEVAPGVGKETDMFFVGPGLGQRINPVGDHVMAELERIYLESRETIDKATKKAEQDFCKFVDDLPAKSTSQSSAVDSSPASESSQ